MYDGYLTVEGQRSEAIFVEAQERGGVPPSVIFAQRYRPGGRFKKFTTIGNAAFVGEGDGLFRPVSDASASVRDVTRED